MDKIFEKGGALYIQKLIHDGVENGSRQATVSGAYEIEKAILLPSDFTLILKNCHLRMDDGVFDNMFRNDECGNILERKSGGENKNIVIRGVGEAILDGGEYNGLSERNAGRDGRPPMYVNNLLLFVNVEGFEIRDIHCRNQRWYALCFVYCGNGILSDIDFCSNDTSIDENGNVTHFVRYDNRKDVLVHNADGIDVITGCHDIKIENITGFTEDDTVAVNGVIQNDGFIAFETKEKPLDICRIEIKNIRSAAHCANVRLLSQGGVPLHDILVDGVYDTSAESPHMDVGGNGVRVGDWRFLYGRRQPTEDEVYNITVKNVRSRAKEAALNLGGVVKNLVFENIEAFDGAIAVLDKREKC
ncbi:MAG: hypothetical protein E7587_09130 [Ruminococcaceae bacterium]|nr:hypothetical protein [Oscillospiraceae bacterium]